MDRRPRPSRVARFARWSEDIVTSPRAPIATLLVIVIALYFLPPLGIPAERVSDVHFLIGVTTLLLVYLLEHNEHRDTTAIHVKLDEILDALRADRRKVGIEELSSDKIKDIRDAEREEIASS